MAHAAPDAFDQFLDVIRFFEGRDSESTYDSFFSISCWRSFARSTSWAASLMFCSRSALRISSRWDLPLGRWMSDWGSSGGRPRDCPNAIQASAASDSRKAQRQSHAFMS